MTHLQDEIQKWEDILSGDLDLFRGCGYNGFLKYTEKAERAYRKYQGTFGSLFRTREDLDETILTCSPRKRKKIQPRIERMLVVLSELNELAND